MKTTTITHKEAQESIWLALDALRGELNNGRDNCETILDILLWAAIAPTSQESVIGYFDAMQSISDNKTWEAIKSVIDKKCKRENERSIIRDETTPEAIEKLRVILLPLARAVASGTKEDKKVITESLLQTRERLIGKRGYLGCSYSMGQLWKELCKDESDREIACLFTTGASAAVYLAEEHAVQTHTINLSQSHWIKGLALLLGEAIKPLDPKGGWPIAIACPPFGMKTKEQLINDPEIAGIELQGPKGLRDLEARRILTTHHLCTEKTFALASPAIGFSGSKDIELFRQELIKKNWLEAVIELPAGIHLGTNIGGLLLILSHTRKDEDRIAIISGENLISKGKRKTGSTELDPVAITELAKLIKKPVDSKICKLVDAEEIARNGYILSTSRYLKTQTDLEIEAFLEARKTLQLGDIAEVKRPLASLGKKSEEGIILREVTLSDISDSGLITEGSREIQIPEEVITKGRDQLINEGDVLLSIKGSIGKAAVVEKMEVQTVPGQAFCSVKLRPNAPLSAHALVQYLRSEIGQALFKKLSQGTAVAFIPMGTVKSIPVIIPTDEEKKSSDQIKSETNKLSTEIKRLKGELNKISQKGWLKDFTHNQQTDKP